jgi:glutathione synthase/RimK-type ligase-like ATP-grasp enzyme
LETLFASSELLIAQRFTPTQFDWRIGVLDGEPLYACRYHMAKGHWQIINATGGKEREGAAETVAIEDAPPIVIRTALRATKLIGNGLYGVDLKEIDGKVIVIEVNDNPNIDVGVEDLVIGDQLYRAIAESFARRVEQIRSKGGQGRG